MSEGQRSGFVPVPLPPAELIPDDAILTQYGVRNGWDTDYRDRPRHPKETDVSLLLDGTISANEAEMLIRNYSTGRAAVRRCFAGDLRQHGFTVRHTPSVRIPCHVSVTHPDGTPWDDDQSMAFQLAFLEFTSGGER